MPIAGSDIVDRLATSSPFDGISLVGGAVLSTGKILPHILSGSDKLQFKSSSSSDLQTLTVVGRTINGYIYKESIILNGTTVVKGRVEFRHLLEISLSSPAVGTISVIKQSGNTTILSFEATRTKYSTLFKGANMDEFLGYTQYDKFFIRNNHATDALTSATITPITDSTGGLSFGLDLAVNSNLSTHYRSIPPVGVTFTSLNVAMNVPGGSLAAGSVIGVWIRQHVNRRQRFNQGQTITLRVSGSSIIKDISGIQIEPVKLGFNTNSGVPLEILAYPKYDGTYHAFGEVKLDGTFNR